MIFVSNVVVMGSTELKCAISGKIGKTITLESAISVPPRLLIFGFSETKMTIFKLKISEKNGRWSQQDIFLIPTD